MNKKLVQPSISFLIQDILDFQADSDTSLLTDKLLDLRNKADFSELSKLEDKNEKILKLAKLCNEICCKPGNENLSKTLNLSEFSLELLLSLDQKSEKAISIEILAYNNLGIIHLRLKNLEKAEICLKAAIKKLGKVDGAGKIELFGISLCNLASLYQQNQKFLLAFNTAEQSRAKLEPYIVRKIKENSILLLSFDSSFLSPLLSLLSSYIILGTSLSKLNQSGDPRFQGLESTPKTFFLNGLKLSKKFLGKDHIMTRKLNYFSSDRFLNLNKTDHLQDSSSSLSSFLPSYPPPIYPPPPPSYLNFLPSYPTSYPPPPSSSSSFTPSFYPPSSPSSYPFSKNKQNMSSSASKFSQMKFNKFNKKLGRIEENLNYLKKKIDQTQTQNDHNLAQNLSFLFQNKIPLLKSWREGEERGGPEEEIGGWMQQERGGKEWNEEERRRNWEKEEIKKREGGGRRVGGWTEEEGGKLEEEIREGGWEEDARRGGGWEEERWRRGGGRRGGWRKDRGGIRIGSGEWLRWKKEGEEEFGSRLREGREEERQSCFSTIRKHSPDGENENFEREDVVPLMLNDKGSSPTNLNLNVKELKKRNSLSHKSEENPDLHEILRKQKEIETTILRLKEENEAIRKEKSFQSDEIESLKLQLKKIDIETPFNHRRSTSQNVSCKKDGGGSTPINLLPPSSTYINESNISDGSTGQHRGKYSSRENRKFTLPLENLEYTPHPSSSIPASSSPIPHIPSSSLPPTSSTVPPPSPYLTNPSSIPPPSLSSSSSIPPSLFLPSVKSSSLKKLLQTLPSASFLPPSSSISVLTPPLLKIDSVPSIDLEGEGINPSMLLPCLLSYTPPGFTISKKILIEETVWTITLILLAEQGKFIWKIIAQEDLETQEIKREAKRDEKERKADEGRRKEKEGKMEMESEGEGRGRGGGRRREESLTGGLARKILGSLDVGEVGVGWLPLKCIYGMEDFVRYCWMPFVGMKEGEEGLQIWPKGHGILGKLVKMEFGGEEYFIFFHFVAEDLFRVVLSSLNNNKSISFDLIFDPISFSNHFEYLTVSQPSKMEYIHSLVEILDDPSPSSTLPPLPPNIYSFPNEFIKIDDQSSKFQTENAVSTQKSNQNSVGDKFNQVKNEQTLNKSENNKFNVQSGLKKVNESRISNQTTKSNENTSFFIENVKIKNISVFLEFLNKLVKCFEEFALPKGVLSDAEEIKVWKGKVKGDKISFWGGKENGERLEIWIKNYFDSHAPNKKMVKAEGSGAYNLNSLWKDFGVENSMLDNSDKIMIYNLILDFYYLEIFESPLDRDDYDRFEINPIATSQIQNFPYFRTFVGDNKRAPLTISLLSIKSEPIGVKAVIFSPSKLKENGMFFSLNKSQWKKKVPTKKSRFLSHHQVELDYYLPFVLKKIGFQLLFESLKIESVSNSEPELKGRVLPLGLSKTDNLENIINFQNIINAYRKLC